MAKTLVVLNPNSNNGKAAQTWESVEPLLREGGLAFDLTRTSGPKQAITLAEQANRDGYETILAAGGDGTVNEIVNGMMRASNGEATGTFGVIPIGSGNDFAKMFPHPATSTSPQPDWRPAIRHILAGDTRLVDVGKVVASDQSRSGERYFANALDTGFGAQANNHAHEIPQLTGTAMYLAAVFKTLIRFTIDQVKIDLDHKSIEQWSTMIAVANGRCIGGGFWIAPNARNDDGLFDVMVAQGLGRIGILSLLPKVMKGTHVSDPRVQMAQSSRVVIESREPIMFETDGEISFVGAHRLDIRILPKRLRMFV